MGKDMKVYVSEKVNSRLPDMPAGSKCLGTISQDSGVATISAVVAPDNALVGTRPVLAVIGEKPCAHSYPLFWSAEKGWMDADGASLETVAYTDKDFFKRTPFNAEMMERLKQERILLIGAGSVGAPMGLELAKTGVGTIIAVDNDILEIHNCMRHVLGSAYVGWPKVEAFKHYLSEHVPMCECVAVHDDLFPQTVKGRAPSRERLRQVLKDTRPTRILAVTDSVRVQYLCQRAAMYLGIPFMAVCCDSNAVEGEIFMWEPGQARGWKPGRAERGCYACLRPPQKRTATTITRSSSFDYSNDNPDTYGGEPALGTFINRINNIASIVMTAWMLNSYSDIARGKLADETLAPYYEDQGLQYIRLGGPYRFVVDGQITADAPWSVQWMRVMKLHDCELCAHPEHNESVLFPPEDEDDSEGEFEDVAALV